MLAVLRESQVAAKHVVFAIELIMQQAYEELKILDPKTGNKKLSLYFMEEFLQFQKSAKD